MKLPVLSLITFLPLLGGLLLLLLNNSRDKLIRGLALLFSLLPLLPLLAVWTKFDPTRTDMQFVERAAWFPEINMEYYLGVDGLSLGLLLLSGIIVPLAILASFKVRENIRAYFFFFLLLQTGLFGVFTALNFVHFFIFWEIGLVPMYFLIKSWGGANRDYASFKFFVMTVFGSIAMLLAFQLLFAATGTFSFTDLARIGQSAGGMGLGIAIANALQRLGFTVAATT